MGKGKPAKSENEDSDSGGGGSSGSGGAGPAQPPASGSGGLKLILKVGSGQPDGGGAAGKVEKHKKKKKKKDHKKKDRKEHKKHKKHKRKLLEEEEVIEDQEDEPPIKVKRVVSTTNNLSRFLEYLLKLLQKKDTNDFFAKPVNDQFAPGYSSIIKQPMDFSTMKSKLQVSHSSHYTNLAAFKSDFELMCTNAMTYNTQDTIYFKSAKKLLNYGRKILSPEKIRGLRNHLPFIKTITEVEFGFNVNDDEKILEKPIRDDIMNSDSDDDTDVAKVIEDIREVVRRPPGRFEAIPDDMTAQEILEHARGAAKRAGEKLRVSKPGSKMGFLRQRPDGTTSLSILTGEPGILPGTEKDRPVSLGALLGKVKQGTSTIAGFREDRRNTCKGVYPLNYGAYSSHGPTYDSTFANLTKEETELIQSTYSDGVQYAESILNFSRNCDHATYIVDHLLDILTGNEHRKTSKYIEEQKKLRREDALLDNTVETIQDLKEEEDEDKKIDFDGLKSLEEEGIDVSFLDALKQQYDKPDEEESMQIKMEKNAELIDQLKKVQDSRLTANTPPHLANLPQPSDQEQELAQKIRNNLVEMASKVQPQFVTSSQGIRKAIGATDLPVSQPPQPPQPEVQQAPDSSTEVIAS